MFAKLHSTLSRLARNESGSTALIFAAGVTVVLAATGAAIDYSTAAMKHTQLSAAVDSAVLGVADRVARDGTAAANNVAAYKALASQFLSVNGPSGSTVAEVHVCLTSGQEDCTVSGGRQLTNGQVYVRGADTYNRVFGSVADLGKTKIETLNAAATASAALLPQSLTFNLQGAKGWYYKTMQIWVHVPGASSDTLMASYVYQPTSLSATASFSVYDALLGHNVSPSGAGTGTFTGPTTVTLGSYDNAYVTMNVQTDPCPPGKNYTGAAASFVGLSSCTTTAQGVNTQGISVTTDANTPAAAAAYSQYLYINFTEEPANTVLPITTLFPCGQTVNHQWEDGGNTPGAGLGVQADFFYGVTTVCATNVASTTHLSN
jgi:Flp pilus assembly protein TadG